MDIHSAADYTTIFFWPASFFTLNVFSLLFLALLGGGYFFLKIYFEVLSVTPSSVDFYSEYIALIDGKEYPVSLSRGKFAEGALREVHFLKFLNEAPPEWRDIRVLDQKIETFVAKEYKGAYTFKNQKHLQDDLNIQQRCQYWAEIFNNALERIPTLPRLSSLRRSSSSPILLASKQKPIRRFLIPSLSYRLEPKSTPPTKPPKKINFLTAKLVELWSVGDKERKTMLVEPYIKGKFVKWTNNWKYVNKRNLNNEAPHAFAHFVYHHTQNSEVPVDLQGFEDENGYYLTDPMIHIVSKKGVSKEEEAASEELLGNFGKQGIENWEVNHHCNNICRMLGLEDLKKAKAKANQSLVVSS